ncbi:MAG: exodeoxyribonuclease VII large subunit, partial [Armatimonadota bacterium]
RDITTILSRRFPLVEQILVPTVVQGEQAAPSIVESLRVANALPDVDLIILGRGGGSIEDLWAFNEEPVVRAIYASRVPVVSAVGHETDFTIADFVADVRAPTPSAAAEMAVPDKAELWQRLDDSGERLRLALVSTLERWRSALAAWASRRALRHPEERVQQLEQAVDELSVRLNTHYQHALAMLGAQTDSLAQKLSALGPGQTLKRGYALCSRVEDGRVVTSIQQLAVGDGVDIRLADGHAGADVTSVEEAVA